MVYEENIKSFIVFCFAFQFTKSGQYINSRFHTELSRIMYFAEINKSYMQSRV